MDAIYKSELNRDVPDGLQQILNWMMSKDPAQRYPTPERAAQALQVFLIAETEPVRREEQPTLKKYLTWLDMNAEANTEAPPAPVKTPPRASRAAAPPAMTASRADWVARISAIAARVAADATTAARRPNLLAGGEDEIRQLLAVRTPLYRAAATLQVATDDRSPSDIAAEIVAQLELTRQSQERA